jgi:hypothetical protein
LNEFTRQQGIIFERLQLLDVLSAREHDVYTPQNTYNLGKLYKLRLVVGVQPCILQKDCPIDQGLLINATLLTLVNQSDEYSFDVLDPKFKQ